MYIVSKRRTLVCLELIPVDYSLAASVFPQKQLEPGGQNTGL